MFGGDWWLGTAASVAAFRNQGSCSQRVFTRLDKCIGGGQPRPREFPWHCLRLFVPAKLVVTARTICAHRMDAMRNK